jgi:hypothetical protein
MSGDEFDQYEGTRVTLAFAQRNILILVDAAIRANQERPEAVAALEELRASIRQHMGPRELAERANSSTKPPPDLLVMLVQHCINELSGVPAPKSEEGQRHLREAREAIWEAREILARRRGRTPSMRRRGAAKSSEGGES